jgi:hypothetical protein
MCSTELHAITPLSDKLVDLHVVTPFLADLHVATPFWLIYMPLRLILLFPAKNAC